MRTRSEGTQASGEGESHPQDANVADSQLWWTDWVEAKYPDNHRTTRR